MQRALRHRFGDLAADRAMVLQQSGRDTELLALGLVGIGDPAAVVDIRGSGDRRERSRDKTAGATFRRRDLPSALAVALVVAAVVLRSVALMAGAAVDLPEPAPLGTATTALPTGATI